MVTRISGSKWSFCLDDHTFTGKLEGREDLEPLRPNMPTITCDPWLFLLLLLDDFWLSSLWHFLAAHWAARQIAKTNHITIITSETWSKTTKKLEKNQFEICVECFIGKAYRYEVSNIDPPFLPETGKSRVMQLVISEEVGACSHA